MRNRNLVMVDLVIGPDRQVSLHFAIKFEDGTVIDSTFEKSPAIFVVGDGNLLPGFEGALLGLKAGDQQTLRIAPEQGFGMPNPNNVQVVPKNRFTNMELEPGLMVSFAAAGEGEMPGVVQSFDDQEVTIDFNHPLAGRVLLFEVEILNVSVC